MACPRRAYPVRLNYLANSNQSLSYLPLREHHEVSVLRPSLGIVHDSGTSDPLSRASHDGPLFWPYQI
jgi:hypothetical protein